MNKSAKEIIEMYESLSEEIRCFVSRYLMDTSDEKRMNVSIALDYPNNCGLCELEKPMVRYLWQNPTGGEISVEFWDDTQADFSDLDLSWQIEIVKYLEDFYEMFP